MKKQLLFIILITLFFSCRHNFNSSLVHNPATASGKVDKDKLPEITFEKKTHDFGKVIDGEKVSYSFKFKNTGIEPLILSNVTSSCGCTVPEWPREPILKGKSASVKVKYDTNRIGPINKTITVISNAKEASVQLKIIGNVVEAPTGTQMPTNNQGAAPVAK